MNELHDESWMVLSLRVLRKPSDRLRNFSIGRCRRVAGPAGSSGIDEIRKQLAAPGWNRVVETRSKKTHADVDIYLMTQGKQVLGLALIASEPREITIVNIVGAIDLDKLHKLEGQFGVPKLDP
jgi:hypothetical protein